jgi:hypothetical protein
VNRPKLLGLCFRFLARRWVGVRHLHKGFKRSVIGRRMVAGEGDVVWWMVVLGCDTGHQPRLREEGVDQRSDGSAILYSERAIL